MPVLDRLKAWARGLKLEVVALYLAALDGRTPWYAKALALAVVAYAVSPIDLIPDFIPVLGYLDDLVLLPLGLLAVRRLVPDEVLEECRARARDGEAPRIPGGRAAAVAVLLLWLVVAVAVWARVSYGGCDTSSPPSSPRR